jgi:hypothetical protein
MDNSNILAKRRDRIIASFLSFKERECDQYLPPEISAKLRKKFLDDINDLSDIAIDLIAEDDVVWNEEFISRLDDIYNILKGEDE